MRVLVKGGTIVTAENEYKADILIEDEKISAIGTHFDGPRSHYPGGSHRHLHSEEPQELIRIYNKGVII